MPVGTSDMSLIEPHVGPAETPELPNGHFSSVQIIWQAASARRWLLRRRKATRSSRSGGAIHRQVLVLSEHLASQSWDLWICHPAKTAMEIHTYELRLTHKVIGGLDIDSSIFHYTTIANAWRGLCWEGILNLDFFSQTER